MNFYPVSSLPHMTYNARPVPPVTKTPEVNGALQTKTVGLEQLNGSSEVDSASAVLGNGDFAISNSTASPAAGYGAAVFDDLTQQRVWSA